MNTIIFWMNYPVYGHQQLSSLFSVLTSSTTTATVYGSQSNVALISSTQRKPFAVLCSLITNSVNSRLRYWRHSLAVTFLSVYQYCFHVHGVSSSIINFSPIARVRCVHKSTPPKITAFPVSTSQHVCFNPSVTRNWVQNTPK